MWKRNGFFSVARAAAIGTTLAALTTGAHAQSSYDYQSTPGIPHNPYGAQQNVQAYAVPQNPNYAPQRSDTYTAAEVIKAGRNFFGTASGSIAGVIERLFARYGLPNGYILGEEGSGAYFGGLTYGEGVLATRNAGQHRVYWQGPSLGFDWGAQGSQVMVLVYNLPHVNEVLGRFGGVSGEAFVVGGFGTRVLKRNQVMMVPIRTGIGARLGVNMSYLKFTASPTWNPF